MQDSRKKKGKTIEMIEISDDEIEPKTESQLRISQRLNALLLEEKPWKNASPESSGKHSDIKLRSNILAKTSNNIEKNEDLGATQPHTPKKKKSAEPPDENPNGKSEVHSAPKPKKGGEHPETGKSKEDGEKIIKSDAHTSSTKTTDEYPPREKDPKKNPPKPDSSDGDDQKPKKRKNNGDNSSIDKNSKNPNDVNNSNSKNGKKSRKSSTSTNPLTKSESYGKAKQQKQSEKS